MSSEEESNEWSVLARSYDDVLRPRFEPMYNSIANVIVKQIQSNYTGKSKLKLLDYGTGPGEPILTVLKVLETNKLFNVELQATDSSLKMLSVAEDRLNKFNRQNLTIQFFPLDNLVSSNTYDIITMSLVLPYASSKHQMLHERLIQLNSNGLLISTHWPHYSQVPFLVTIKGVGHFMETNEHLNMSELESDGSFSCWREEKTRETFEKAGFDIQDWIVCPLQMFFPNLRTLLSFIHMCSWFNNETLYSKAENEAKRILQEQYGVHFATDGSFYLSNTVIIVVALKRHNQCE